MTEVNVEELIKAFKVGRDFWMHVSADRAWGIQEGINHLYAYQASINDMPGEKIDL